MTFMLQSTAHRFVDLSYCGSNKRVCILDANTMYQSAMIECIPCGPDKSSSRAMQRAQPPDRTAGSCIKIDLVLARNTPG